MSTLKITDSGALKVFRELRMTITGGIHEEQGAEQHDQGPLSVVQVASVNEFGGGRIPARMWLRGWVPVGAKRVVEQIRTAMQTMARTQRYEAGPFEAITKDVMGGIRGRILSGAIQPANAPLTLKNKDPETRPLVEHGQMAAAIHGRLRATNAEGSINWSKETT
ncbi:MAG: hypothetical protein V4593_08250 [Pseudomonadota bacterium]